MRTRASGPSIAGDAMPDVSWAAAAPRHAGLSIGAAHELDEELLDIALDARELEDEQSGFGEDEGDLARSMAPRTPQRRLPRRRSSPSRAARCRSRESPRRFGPQCRGGQMLPQERRASARGRRSSRGWSCRTPDAARPRRARGPCARHGSRRSASPCGRADRARRLEVTMVTPRSGQTSTSAHCASSASPRGPIR